MTLKIAIVNTVSPQGPFSSCCGVFNSMTTVQVHLLIYITWYDLNLQNNFRLVIVFCSDLDGLKDTLRHIMQGLWINASFSLVWKSLSGLQRVLTSTPIKHLFAECEPGLVTQHQWPTSLMHLWPKGNKSLQPGFKILWKFLPNIEAVIARWTMPMVLDRHIQQSDMDIHTFLSMCFTS